MLTRQSSRFRHVISSKMVFRVAFPLDWTEIISAVTTFGKIHFSDEVVACGVWVINGFTVDDSILSLQRCEKDESSSEMSGGFVRVIRCATV